MNTRTLFINFSLNCPEVQTVLIADFDTTLADHIMNLIGVVVNYFKEVSCNLTLFRLYDLSYDMNTNFALHFQFYGPNKKSILTHSQCLVHLALKSHRLLGPCHLSPPTATGGIRQGSNTIMSALFALKFWSNKIIDIDIILYITLTVI